MPNGALAQLWSEGLLANRKAGSLNRHDCKMVLFHKQSCGWTTVKGQLAAKLYVATYLTGHLPHRTILIYMQCIFYTFMKNWVVKKKKKRKFINIL